MKKRLIVKYCGCLAVAVIVVKSAAVSSNTAFRPKVTNIPYSTRDAGAKFQNALYGEGMRLHNNAGKKQEKVCCTVCGKVSFA